MAKRHDRVHVAPWAVIVLSSRCVWCHRQGSAHHWLLLLLTSHHGRKTKNYTCQSFSHELVRRPGCSLGCRPFWHTTRDETIDCCTWCSPVGQNKLLTWVKTSIFTLHKLLNIITFKLKISGRFFCVVRKKNTKFLFFRMSSQANMSSLYSVPPRVGPHKHSLCPRWSPIYAESSVESFHHLLVVSLQLCVCVLHARSHQWATHTAGRANLEYEPVLRFQHIYNSTYCHSSTHLSHTPIHSYLPLSHLHLFLSLISFFFTPSLFLTTIPLTPHTLFHLIILLFRFYAPRQSLPLSRPFSYFLPSR